MSPSRLAAWIFGLAVCTAWLASAAGVGRKTATPRVVPRPSAETELTALASDVQTQASRLRDRLAHAPAPSLQQRNPFAFAGRPQPAMRAPVAPAVAPPVMVAEQPPTEPVLTLIGVAEMNGPAGAVRTAMISHEAGELLMVTTGQTVLGRYTVAVIGADAVRLTETATGVVRTLVLR